MHTPIPWTQDRPQGKIIVDCQSLEVATAYDVIDAAFIVRACNSHAALVQALKGLVDILSEQGWDGQSATDAHDKAIALLDKYKGES